MAVDDELLAQVQRKLVENGDWDRFVPARFSSTAFVQILNPPIIFSVLTELKSRLNELGLLDELANRSKGLLCACLSPCSDSEAGLCRGSQIYG